MISVGIDHWYRLKEYEPEESIYSELKLLGRQYRHYMRMRVESVLELTHLLDYTMPGIKTLLKGWNETNGKDKLGDFGEEYWQYYKEIGGTVYRKLSKIGKREGIPSCQGNGGVGNVLVAPKLIAEIGDVRRFHNGKALIAHAGIDAPPYQSGQFTGTERKISKRGSSSLRKIGYEVMRCLKTHKEPEDAAVYRFILKKEKEGKSKRAAKIAGLNKFLRIYYARVMEVYQK